MHDIQCKEACACTHIHICNHAHAHTDTHTYMPACTQVHTHMHACMYKYTHTHTHTHIHLRDSSRTTCRHVVSAMHSNVQSRLKEREKKVAAVHCGGWSLSFLSHKLNKDTLSLNRLFLHWYSTGTKTGLYLVG